MPEDAIFDLASVTKVVGTTTAVMLLADAGRLRLDDPVGSYIPEWQGRLAAEQVSLWHLLTHTSGLPGYLSVGPLEKQYGPGPRPDAVIAAIAGLPLRRTPGSGVEYSCLNAILAGRIAENAAGTDLHSLLTRHVFGPLGMVDTGWFLTPAQVARLAPTAKQGRLDAAGKLPGTTAEAPPLQCPVHDPLARYYTTAQRCSGNAGLFSTAADLGRFARMILGRGELEGTRVLTTKTVGLFTHVETPAGMETRALDWEVWDDHPFRPAKNPPPEAQAIGHLGFTGTMLWIDQGSGLWAVVLTSRLHRSTATRVAGLRHDVVQALLETTTPGTGTAR
jgi:CubicO group peptidase (beta-lactamase class C family)